MGTRVTPLLLLLLSFVPSNFVNLSYPTAHVITVDFIFLLWVPTWTNHLIFRHFFSLIPIYFSHTDLHRHYSVTSAHVSVYPPSFSPEFTYGVYISFSVNIFNTYLNPGIDRNHLHVWIRLGLCNRLCNINRYLSSESDVRI